MKRIKSIFLLMLITSGLFVACKKDSSMTVVPSKTDPPPTVAAEPSPISDPSLAQITLNLTTPPLQNNALIRWYSGYMTLSGISFDAVLVNDARFLVHHTTAINNSQFPLFTTSALGTIATTPGRYDNVVYTLNLANVAEGKESSAATGLFVAGIFTANGMQATVQLMVNEVPQLSVNAGNGLLFDAQSYNPVINLDLNMLTEGITSQMLSNASINNGVITIALGQNTQLYDIMLGNLQRALSLQGTTTKGIVNMSFSTSAASTNAVTK